ncbi:unnamed protein product [Prunus armeniaca]|uniref:F-box associated beta-propeller type 3 domain-containing protein n=1 Tax=Prunus armeniaca TaxID=36596 RepID=A0A6J5W1B4_PRUAR|nr:unnamed protein product [Prunus armeniaca]
MAKESHPRKLVKSRYVCMNPELPTEIIFYHILPRLPPKSLMRCKSWSSLFRSPSFVTAFNNFHCNDRNKSTTNFLFHNNSRLFSSKIEEQQGENNILISTPIAQLPLKTRSQVLERYPDHVQYILNPTPVAEFSYLSLAFRHNSVQCVHGLVCASFTCGPVFILNPSTQESIELRYVIDNNYCFPYATYHFGYSPLTNEYKVLQILSFQPNLLSNRHIRFNTFTLGRDSSWRPLQVDPAHLRFFYDIGHASDKRNGRSTRRVCLNGAIHWIHGTQKIIVVFDVREETFRLVSLPEEYAREFGPDNYGGNRIAFPTGVVEVGGCVGVFADKSWRHNEIVLWILKDYQNLVWVKETITVMPRGAGYVEALGTIHTGELALALHFYGNLPGFENGPPQLLLYDMESKQYRILDFIFSNNMGVTWGIPFKLIASYDDSIVSLK